MHEIYKHEIFLVFYTCVSNTYDTIESIQNKSANKMLLVCAMKDILTRVK